MPYFLKYVPITLLIFSSIKVGAQNVLSLDQAIDIAIESNYGIKISQNNLETLKNSATRGNAGQLPSVDFTGGVTYNNNNNRLKLADFSGSGETQVTTTNGAESRNYDASVTATYTLFNGFNATRTYERLLQNVELGNVQYQQTIENTILAVSNAYYNLGKAIENNRLTVENERISAERLARAESRNEFGVSNRLSVLNAEVDLNADSVNLLNSQLIVANAKRDFNVLLARDPNTPFDIQTEVAFLPKPALEDLQAKAELGNTDVQVAKYNQQVSELDVKIAEGRRYPQVNLNASYGLNRSTNDVGVLLVNQNIGFSGGVRVNFNVFDGNRRNIEIQNAKIGARSSQEQLEQIQQQVERDIYNAYATLENNLYVLQVEQKNLATAERNFERTQEQFNFGQVTSTQFREAQTNLLAAKIRLNNAQYDAKIAEVSLLLLSGELDN